MTGSHYFRLPRPAETVDFRLGDGSLPLAKGAQEGFCNGSFGQIPLNPPFPKGEVNPLSPSVGLSTLSSGGAQTTEPYRRPLTRRGAPALALAGAGCDHAGRRRARTPDWTPRRASLSA